ncbi:hypothetical protein KIN20_031763 [Parelaphostrongylus tenuis]|uniref:Uncharacterized protein n=1 Tax=Parelaphostrongylus tenuis TaxID=148309 RepID=A0AAD5R5V4_PARTN|nr:hypothetical protein KIN20_031763 [Parelaphostrongylus tenuis]
MLITVLYALLCISSGAAFIGNSFQSDLETMDGYNTYPIAEQTSKRIVLEPPLIKRGVDPLSIPQVVREPPLKKRGGDKRDWYIYPSTTSKLSERVPLKEPPLKRDVDRQRPSSLLLDLLLLDSLEGRFPIVTQSEEQPDGEN